MIKNLFASLVILFGSVAPSYALNASDGLYYYRYTNTLVSKAGTTNPSTSKDITAFFVAGMGTEFSEELPMKPQWERDNWVVSGGDLPAGISFDSATRTFTGTPTQAGQKKVDLTGFDNSGTAVASASVTITVYSVPANAVKLDLYAHKGKFFVNTPALPDGVEVCTSCWTTVTPLPPGLSIIGHNIDGTPTQTGTFPIFIQGHDSNGAVNVAYIGKITVEDAPTFPTIADKLRSFDTTLKYTWFNEGITKAKRTVGNPSYVNYSLEVKSGDKLPGTVNLTGQSSSPILSGNVYNTYEQATVRYKVVDTDGAIGYSNWFKLGSAGGGEACVAAGNTPIDLSFTAGVPANFRVPLTGAGVTYALNGGNLPAGLAFDSVSGTISGTPTAAGITPGYSIAVNYSNASQNTVCGPYTISVKSKDAVTVSMSKEVYRTGQPVSGTIVLSDAIATPATVSLSSGSSLPAGLTFNASTRSVTGTVTTPGNYSAVFKVTAQNGATYLATMNIPVLPPLSIAAIPTPINIARYAISDSLASLTVNPATVWKTATYEVVGNGTLPTGITIDAVTKKLVGGTADDIGTYGPFQVKVTDGSGDSVLSNNFSIVVGPRAGLTITSTTPAKFVTNKTASLRPVVISLPPKATTLSLTYSIQPALPAGLTLQPSSGFIVGVATTAGTFPGYTVTGTDSEGSTITSSPFTITISEPANPDAANLGIMKANVGRFFTTPNINFFVDTLIGDASQVTYVDYQPVVPGLTLDTNTGLLSGIPTQTFEGQITINFKDSAGRDGSAKGQLTVLPAPSVSMTQSSYDLPRMSSAQNYNIEATDNGGFIGAINWSLAPDSAVLPLGLSVSGNRIIGSTTSSERTVSGLKLQATDTVTNVTVQTQPFSIKIGARVALGLVPAPDMAISYITEAGVETRRTPFTSVAPTGSYIAPLTYSISGMSELPASLTINPTTGQFATFPSYVGTWPVTMTVKDGEGNTATAAVSARTTLDGAIGLAPSSIDKKVRVGEEFQTDAITPSNSVGIVTYATNGSSLPVGVTFDETTGQISGTLTEPVKFSRKVSATDSHNRINDGRYPVTVQVEAVPALSLASVGNITATQFSPSQKIDATLPAVGSAIGNITYAISGNVPGTLVYRLADGSNYLASNMSVINGALPNDAIVFDVATRKLTGIPSQAGTFNVTLVAVDDHGVGAANTASSPFQIVVAPAATMTVAQSLNAETLNVLTKQPTVTVTVSNAAYGKVTWSKIAGTLPAGVTAASTNDTTLAYSGYPTTAGSYPGIIYRATDGAGRTVDVPALSFTVQARQPLALVASANPKGMIVNAVAAPLDITANNAARGEPVTFTVNGTLPEGITSATVDGKLRFSGTPTVIANYPNIQVTATDSSGATANLTVAINVISPTSAIGLTVSNITTKVGLPFTMAPPYAAGTLSTSNTYGSLAFSSDDLPGDKGLTINPTTGAFEGTGLAAANFTFNLKVTDDTNRVTSKPVTVTVLPPLQITVASQVSTRQSANIYTNVTKEFAIGNVTFSKGTGTWPNGITVDPNTGTISGFPTSPTGYYDNLTIRGTDGSGDVQLSNTFRIEVLPTLATPNIADINQAGSNKLKMTVGTPFSYTPQVTSSIDGSTWNFGNLTFSINKPLPAGVTLNTSTGVISGTPTEPSIDTGYVITVKNQVDAGTSTPAFWLGVQPAGDLMVDTTGWHQFGDGSYSKFWNVRQGETLQVSVPPLLNAYGPLTFAQTGSGTPFASLPDSTTGVITLSPTTQTTPRAAGTAYYQSVSVADAFGRSTVYRYDYAVDAAPSISYANSNATVGTSFTLNPTLSGFTGTASYAISPALPAGLVLNPSTGAITGTPTAQSATQSYTVIATGSDFSTSNTFTLTVAAAPAATIGYASPQTGVVGTAMSFGPTTTTNVLAGSTYTVSPSLPAGLSINPTTGLISGTPTAASGTQTYTVTNTGLNGTATANFNLTINAMVVGSRYWRFQCTTATQVPGAPGNYQVAFGEIRAFSGGTDITSQADYFGPSYGGAYSGSAAKNGVNTDVGWATAYMTNDNNTAQMYLDMTFPTVVSLDRLDLYKYMIGVYNGDGSGCAAWTVKSSQDGNAWTNVWSDSRSNWISSSGFHSSVK